MASWEDSAGNLHGKIHEDLGPSRRCRLVPVDQYKAMVEELEQLRAWKAETEAVIQQVCRDWRAQPCLDTCLSRDEHPGPCDCGAVEANRATLALMGPAGQERWGWLFVDPAPNPPAGWDEDLLKEA